MSASDAERIEALEMRIAYQDQAIEDLNAAITAQWKTIDALTRRLARMEEELAEAEISARGEAGGDKPPPHY